MKRPEILAPAGTMESLIAAVNCGADAVYLGAKALNARRNAVNFDETALKEAVEYSHLHGTKVLQTLNIVMFDGEESELISAAETIAKLGVDAAIVQDWGVVSILKKAVPELPLHASTQMAIHNLAGAKMAERLGCKRIVLARELTAAEIAHIVNNVSAEIEVFVHGALCMSVSGQCYLSSMLGGRSGNRGLCAQPCRLPFGCGSASHALSLKDLSLTERVSELCSLGVASLKIEGRMKRPEYVAAAVTALRNALDGQTPDMEQLRSVFSRSGFTTGYFDSKRDGTMFGIRQKEDVVSASSVLGELSKLASTDIGAVAVEGAFTACENEPISLSVRDKDKNIVYVEGEIPQKAINKPTDEQRVSQNLNKTGNTAFHFSELDIELDDGLMIPVSQINALRRAAFEELSELRKKPRTIRFTQPDLSIKTDPLAKKAPVLRVRCSAFQLSKELIGCCDELLLPLCDIQKALDFGIAAEKIVAEIPRILFRGEDETLKQLITAKQLGVIRAWCGNIGAFSLAEKAGMRISGGWSMNVTNRYSLEQLKELGMEECELSFELPLQGAKQLAASARCGLIAYGMLPLMAFRNCPVKSRIGCKACNRKASLTDRMGISFPVRCPEHNKFSGESELLNSVPLYLADRKNELFGFDFLTLWFTDENSRLCAEIAATYKKGNKNTPDKFTRGLYYRTVL